MFSRKISMAYRTLNLFADIHASWLKARSISTAPVLFRLGFWRVKKGLPACGREYGPMTDLPDWSYEDGRPAPLGELQKQRINLQKSYCEQIIKLTKEVDKCLELNKEKAAMEEQKRQDFLKNSLKSKGKRFA